jgi:hypothetical protein
VLLCAIGLPACRRRLLASALRPPEEAFTQKAVKNVAFTRAEDGPFGSVSWAGNQGIRGRSKPPERRLQPGLAASLSDSERGGFLGSYTQQTPQGTSLSFTPATPIAHHRACEVSKTGRPGNRLGIVTLHRPPAPITDRSPVAQRVGHGMDLALWRFQHTRPVLNLHFALQQQEPRGWLQSGTLRELRRWCGRYTRLTLLHQALPAFRAFSPRSIKQKTA